MNVAMIAAILAQRIPETPSGAPMMSTTKLATATLIESPTILDAKNFPNCTGTFFSRALKVHLLLRK